ncbi:MAG: hypothetical protein AM324_002345 [Candidatus Thorarchaeota archaeon SMTZ1-83]|nr:MAG: hypothetical protein AM324_03250 [Candidatus Thorarchaeota archaeon SMTZ1-83]
MRPRAQWLIYFAAVICFALTVLGGLSYPLTGAELPSIIAYEVGIFIGIFGILFLVHQKALPGS